MLHHGEQLDVGEAEVDRVVGELVREVAVAQPAPVGPSTPRAQVDLVDRHRRREGAPLGSGREPVGVAPVVGEVPHDGAGLGRQLRVERERVGLVDAVAAVARADVELVGRGRAGRHRRRRTRCPEDSDRGERMRVGVPAVEVPDHGDVLRVRCPDGERGAAGVGGGRRACRRGGRVSPRRTGRDRRRSARGGWSCASRCSAPAGPSPRIRSDPFQHRRDLRSVLQFLEGPRVASTPVGSLGAGSRHVLGIGLQQEIAERGRDDRGPARGQAFQRRLERGSRVLPVEVGPEPAAGERGGQRLADVPPRERGSPRPASGRSVRAPRGAGHRLPARSPPTSACRGCSTPRRFRPAVRGALRCLPRAARRRSAGSRGLASPGERFPGPFRGPRRPPPPASRSPRSRGARTTPGPDTGRRRRPWPRRRAGPSRGGAARSHGRSARSRRSGTTCRNTSSWYR